MSFLFRQLLFEIVKCTFDQYPKVSFGVSRFTFFRLQIAEGEEAKEHERTNDVEAKEILAELDQEIHRLQQARTLLAGGSVARPKATRKKASGAAATAGKSAPKKRTLTPEGRKRIAEAMKRRWAERKKQAAAKAAK